MEPKVRRVWLIGLPVGGCFLLWRAIERGLLPDPRSVFNEHPEWLILAAIGLGAAFVYLLPFLFAVVSGHPKRRTIFIVNLLLGWTAFVHVILLLWVLWWLIAPKTYMLASEGSDESPSEPTA